MNTGQGTGTLSGLGGVTSSGNYTWNPWLAPELVETRVYPDRIELIYQQQPTITYTSMGEDSQPSPRIFKRVYKAQLVEEVEGRWIPPSNGYFDFNDNIHRNND